MPSIKRGPFTLRRDRDAFNGAELSYNAIVQILGSWEELATLLASVPDCEITEEWQPGLGLQTKAKGLSAFSLR
jgi:hypothetical protein